MAVSTRYAFFPQLLESDSEIYGVSKFTLAVTANAPEHNPYRPTIPESVYDVQGGGELADYLRENQEILRQQHNITQAGDSTFPWQLFVKTHSEQQFNLGSIARFYHGDWGIIRGRYVRFDFMQATDLICAPVGLLKNDDSHSWVVTNRYDLSHPDLVVGFVAGTILPVDGEYGWVLIDGPNLQPVTNDSETAEIGETFSWSQTGSISNTAQGRVIGRRVNKVAGTATALEIGQLYIQLESFALESIKQAIVEATANLEKMVEDLQEDVDVLKSLTVLDDTFKNLNKTITLLQTNLNKEITDRRAADNSINNRISNLNFVTGGELGAAVTNLQNALATLQTALAGQLSQVNQTALEALTLAQANGFDPSAIQLQLSAILDMVSSLERRPKGKFPVVDGAIPPNLVYLDDGSLVYVETF